MDAVGVSTDENRYVFVDLDRELDLFGAGLLLEHCEAPTDHAIQKERLVLDRDAPGADARNIGQTVQEGEQVCIVTVGGSGVGQALLKRVAAAFPAARSRVEGLRTGVARPDIGSADAFRDWLLGMRSIVTVYSPSRSAANLQGRIRNTGRRQLSFLSFQRRPEKLCHTHRGYCQILERPVCTSKL